MLEFVVRAKGYVRYRFEITPEMRDAHVNGHFNASGGTGNDIQAIICDRRGVHQLDKRA